MKETVLRIENLVKVYEFASYGKARRVFELFYRLFGDVRKTIPEGRRVLDGISFELKRGEAIGILGRNGSGKSTMLQIIAGTLAKTAGRVEKKGRISAILELGTGFNPEFSGLDNAKIGCSLLGLRDAEIDAAIPLIENFADIGDYFRKPVRTYSSGMFVRLAFAVMISVKPDILIVDEALAVGDIAFQRKCFAKLKELRDNGVTLLFVSHEIEMIKQVCDRALLLEEGKILQIGDPKVVAASYLSLMWGGAPEALIAETVEVPEVTESRGVDRKPDMGLGHARVVSYALDGIQIPHVHGGERIRAKMVTEWDVEKVFQIAKEMHLEPNVILGLSISDKKGLYMTGFTTWERGQLVSVQDGRWSGEFVFEFPHLMPGDFFINLTIALGTQEHHQQLAWYEGVVLLNCQPNRKYTYGLFYQQYQINRHADSNTTDRGSLS